METIKKRKSLEKLTALGQSAWLDYIHRQMIRSGRLKELIEQYCVRGVTSNPAIFEKAIVGTNYYDDEIKRLVGRGKNAAEIYEILAVQDVREAADVLRPVYNESQGGDGFVSLEVSPYLARDTNGTISEARRLWKEVDRPNLLVKIPAIVEGLGAIRQCISEGINVNVTLIFGLARYEKVAQAYIEGLQQLLEQGRSLKQVTSVASFFLSRIDVLLDPVLEKMASPIAQSLVGQAAILCAKAAYQMYRRIFEGAAFKKFADKDARPQRLLWASTGTKNPSYSDVKYVEPIIGPQTINTMPMETLEAYGDHGQPAGRLQDGIDQVNQMLARFGEIGVKLNEVSDKLEEEGIEKFVKPYDSLIESLKKKGAS